MAIAHCKAARRKMRQRYGNKGKVSLGAARSRAERALQRENERKARKTSK